MVSSVLGGLICCCGFYVTYKCRPEKLPAPVRKRFDRIYKAKTIGKIRSGIHKTLDKVGLDYEIADRRGSVSRRSVAESQVPGLGDDN